MVIKLLKELEFAMLHNLPIPALDADGYVNALGSAIAELTNKPHPVILSFEIRGGDNTEIDMLNICVDAIDRLPKAPSRRRVVNYLSSRFVL